MATREQCGQELRRRLKTEKDVIEFTAKWGGKWSTVQGWSEQTLVANNIHDIIDNAHREEKLDLLGIELGFPSDAESKRLTTAWAIRRSWIAIGVSIVAIGLSVFAVVSSHR